ncbi:hypothetical protein [Algoriphagus sp. CAU 1675]|uniref:hypothetical protein n=1 Tax=Algoriphagus sp. CAU 1675 TaxID=3032597 RepID=UPI0023DCEA4C|nr:hypothetical protein [Algoriphagus sp. CAU 1675]MDF2156300.1 hypothetical protein [Algoriphagus sp. CAU 1675]
MSKLIPISINGSNWIQLSQLSVEQALRLKSWLPVNSLKKINLNGIELNDCVAFDTYLLWFRSHQLYVQRQALLDF